MNIIERDVGTIPVSMGTSLSLEGMMGVYPDPARQPKQPVKPNAIGEVWINLRTLARNMYNAVPTAAQSSLNLAGAVDVLEEEVKVIPVALAQMGWKGKVKFYMASKDAIKWSYPHANFKDTDPKKAPKQAFYDTYERYVSIELYKRLMDSEDPPLTIDSKPPSTQGTVALLTHFPTELMWKPQFTRLLLLESHTGKLKAWNMWYTKLNGIDEATMMPFNEYTLQVFGDSVVLAPQSISIKKALKEVAINKKWTSIVSIAKVHYDIMDSKNKDLIANYKQLMK